MASDVVVIDQEYPIELAISAWLHAKGQRTGSKLTEHSYQEIIQAFRSALRHAGLDLDSDTRAVALVAQAWASRDRHGQCEVSANTYNHHLAILSSFYSFSRKRGLLDIPNPISLVDRRPVQEYAAAQPISPKAISQALQSIDTATPEGARNYALLTVALHTGRRVSELAGLRWGDIRVEDGQLQVTWRCKGAKVMRDKLTPAVSQAVMNYLQMVYGPALGTLSSDAPVWVSFSRNASKGSAIGTQALADICRKHLGTSKVHSTRHSFAVSMERVGAHVSEIQSRLGHASLAVTGRYLAALRSEENAHAGDLSRLWGIE